MNPRQRKYASGMTLIELMVSMALGLFLTWGAFQVYFNSKANYRAAETLTRLQENARFALETLEPDLRLAGNWGMHNQSALVTPATGIAVACDGADASDFALAFAAPIEVVDDDYDLVCAPHSEARAGSDVLIVRHASEDTAPVQAGKVQLQSDLARTTAFVGGAIPAGFSADSETYDLVVHAYYVDNTSSFSDSVPSLRRQTLVAGALIEDQEMITGVENLQVQYGLDTDGDGSVERYVDPDSPAVTVGAIGFIPGARIVAVRLWMLVRSEESPGPEFSDGRSYQPLDLDEDLIVPAEPLYPPQFQRLEVTKTVYLSNQAAGGA